VLNRCPRLLLSRANSADQVTNRLCGCGWEAGRRGGEGRCRGFDVYAAEGSAGSDRVREVPGGESGGSVIEAIRRQ
jgi:hypothetical protein